MEEIATLDAKALARGIVLLSSQVKSATLLPDQKIELNGQKIRCYVIPMGANDFRSRKSDVKPMRPWTRRAK